MKISCKLFGCAYDPVDDSSPFLCFRCDSEVEGRKWCYGWQPFRKIYRLCMGWSWRES
jgi:hypothetical protein